LTELHNKIENVRLIGPRTGLNSDNRVTFRISFTIGGKIREVFDQKSWERAYNLHDNLFRIKIDIDLKSGTRNLAHRGSLRKASLFWTRNPKLPYRIWILIIKDDATFYPSSIEEARSLLFDVEQDIAVDALQIDVRKQDVYAQIRVWWGKHQYTPSCELKSKTNKISLHETY
jgi:hypothetical protein